MTTLFRTNRLRGVGAHISRVLPLLFSAALVLLLPACVEEIAPPNNDNETTITFSVNTPKDFSPTSYALSENEEKTVTTVDVILFNSSTKAFVSGPHYGVVNGSNVLVRIPETAGNYDMVVFANCNDEVTSVATSLSGKTKSTVLELAGLCRSVTAGNGDSGLTGGSGAGWLTSTGNKTIPMYGETTVTVNGSTATVNGTVSLTRMLARVNVTNSASGFTLSEVYLCNYNLTGRIAPASNWSASNPSFVSGVQQTGYSKAIKYSTTSANKSERDIYTFEAAAGSVDGDNNPCLVVAGTYGGSTNYYRIDFVNSSSAYQPLLRNYTYDVNITTISGKGYSTMKEALESRPVNILYDITPWSPGNVSNVVYDGQYALGVSQNSFTFDNSARTTSSTDNTITVTTNFPTAWTVSVPTQSPSGWLTATKSGSTVRLTCASTASARTATVRITAGRMVQDISVTQIKDEVAITFKDAASTIISEVLYESVAGVQPAAQSFSVSWTPATASVSFTKTTVGSTAFAISSGTSINDSGTLTGGSASYTNVRPSAWSDFTKDRASAINYTLTYGGVTVSKSLVLRQRVTPATPTITFDNDELVFESKAGDKPESKSFRLSWTPTSVTPTYTGDFKGTIGSVNHTNSPSGNVPQSSGTSVNVTPDAISVSDFNSGITERTSFVTYQVSNGGNSVSKTLKIRQKAFLDPLPVSINAARYYPRTGNKEKFFVTSNSGSVTWRVKSVVLSSNGGTSPIPLSSFTPRSGGSPSSSTATTSTSMSSIVEFTTDDVPTSNTKITVTLESTTGTYSDISIVLNIGGSYTPTTSVSDVVWAGSNIYWVPTDDDKGYLTFDGTDGSPTISSNEQKQGVFFRWGSLWGISPLGDSWSGSIDLYPPDGGTQKASVAPIGGTWSNIPLAPAAGSSETNRAYLYERTGSTASEGTSLQPIGDICKWLTDKGWAPGSKTGTRWRMPTYSEFGLGTTSDDDTKTKFSVPPDNALDASPEWTNLTSTGTITDVTGQGSVPLYRGRWNTQVSTKPYFPASGSRNFSNGALYYVGTNGTYWTGSPPPAGTNASNLYFNSTNARMGSNNRTNGFTVRCVQEN